MSVEPESPPLEESPHIAAPPPGHGGGDIGGDGAGGVGGEGGGVVAVVAVRLSLKAMVMLVLALIAIQDLIYHNLREEPKKLTLKYPGRNDPILKNRKNLGRWSIRKI